ncbi:lipid-A-disaccharide kinase [Kerstersia gyiorum]|uniref:Tetraacyldisaccharide 4'-kinase n=2 Tax=Kerstersia gyiorum TaxID=206506 RepID=A0A4Q7MPE4_9BURK|nr:lipid-A-disaccharide kinase [Kerstersia gyiorum]
MRPTDRAPRPLLRPFFRHPAAFRRMPSPLRASLTRFVQHQWQQGGWLSTLLRPLGALAAWHVRNKRSAYATGRKPSWRAPVPVIVIGNIYVGGTGKTPVTIATVNALRAQGWRPGVISRGYGADIGAAPRCGMAPLDATLYGDEPALIAAATGVPVGVHPKRPLAAQTLLARWPDIDILICDDGLQHLALQRDIEIVVQDERGTGNGRLLPAGPLREPVERLQDVDIIITNRQALPAPAAKATTTTALRPMTVSMSLQPERYEHLSSGRSLSPAMFTAEAAGLPLAAAAGIGNPARYFAMLRQQGLHLDTTLPLPDHHAYDDNPFARLQAERILITAKDATKCRALTDDRLWVVHAAPSFQPADWLARLPLPANEQAHAMNAPGQDGNG